MLQLLNKIALLVLILMFANLSKAELVRFGADGGLGQAIVTVSGAKRTEGPITFSFLVDYTYTSQLVIGAEHYRTLINDNGPSSGVGFTGLTGKYYFTTFRAQVLPTSEQILDDAIVDKGFSYYAGASIGVAQASLRALDASQSGNRSLSVGGYIGGKFGVEYPWYRNYTVFAEFNFAFTIVGTGSVMFPRTSIGVFYAL